MVCAEDAARLAAEEAQTLAADAQASADARMAELRVAQDSLKSMREECNERWVSSVESAFQDRTSFQSCMHVFYSIPTPGLVTALMQMHASHAIYVLHNSDSWALPPVCVILQMSERSARAQLAEQQSQLAALEEDMQKLRDSLESRTDDLMTQRAVNQQLMLKKEEVEWQLMAAIAKVRLKEGDHIAAADQH